MGYVGEIPGMYYDKDKGKYFKIQANAPAKSAYSAQDVKRRKLEDEKAQSLAEDKARQKGRIRRSLRAGHPLAGGILAREYGYSSLDGPGIFANGLVSQGYCLEQYGPPFDLIFAVQERRDLGPSMIDLRTFHEDRLIRTRINADLEGRVIRQGMPSDPPFFDEYLGDSATSTSISIHEGKQRLLATWMAEFSNSGIAIVPIGTDPQAETGPNVILGPGRSRGAEVDVHSSTAAPESSSLLFAIGTSEGILTIDKQNDDAHFLSRKLYPPNHAQDVFALEFMSHQPSVLMSGGRNGILNITDLRVPDFGQQADVIKHQSSITHIKQLDTYRIIVAGLKSSLCQYDLRFRKGPQRTQSILQYPEYQNTASIRIGFDVDLESGVIAAAQESDISHPPVQLFSLHGGHTLRSSPSLIGKEIHEYPRSYSAIYSFADDSSVVPCVRFVRDVEGKMKSLYVAADVIRKYAWGEKGQIKSMELDWR